MSQKRNATNRVKEVLDPPKYFYEDHKWVRPPSSEADKLQNDTSRSRIEKYRQPDGTEIYRKEYYPEREIQKQKVYQRVQKGISFARDLGVRVAPHHISEDAVISKAIDGKELKRTPVTWNDQSFPLDEFVTDCAKIIVIGHQDFSSLNVIITDDLNDFRQIDISVKPLREVLYRLIGDIGQVYRETIGQPQLLILSQVRAIDIARYILQSNEYHDQIEENCNVVLNDCPVGPRPFFNSHADIDQYTWKDAKQLLKNDDNPFASSSTSAK